MKVLRNCLLVAGALCALTAQPSGFALYEASVISHAMGNALVGKAMDASANFNNPATLTDLTNIQFTVGFVTEHPRGRADVCRNSRWQECTMDPGMFWLPHFQLAVPLPWGFAFGLGASAEYGLGSNYGWSWPMNWNTTETTVQGFVLNPNLAWKWGDFSIGAGLRWLYFDFEQYKTPYADTYGINTLNYHLKGDNGWKSLGWQIGAKYDILDNLSVGVVYKSSIDVDVEGESNVKVRSASSSSYASALAAKAAACTGDADASLRLPQSITAGINWDVTDTWHLGTAVSWTQWSEFDTIIFNVQPTANSVNLDWRDTWRFSIASCWDFADDWKWMASYSYDMDCTQNDQDSTMLPPANRHILATGFAWNVWRGLELAISYSCIFMDGRDMHTTDSFGNSYTFDTCWGFCHAGGFSVTYRF